MITEPNKHDEVQRVFSPEEACELKNTINKRTGITYSVVTSGTDSGDMMYDTASTDCKLSTLLSDTTSSKLEWISATCSPSYN